MTRLTDQGTALAWPDRPRPPARPHALSICRREIAPSPAGLAPPTLTSCERKTNFYFDSAIGTRASAIDIQANDVDRFNSGGLILQLELGAGVDQVKLKLVQLVDGPCNHIQF